MRQPLIALCLLAACSPAEDTDKPSPDYDGGGDYLTRLATGSDCSTPSGAGTEHSGFVEADETWAAADGPHRVTARLYLKNGARLTIEPCAEVRLAAGVSIEIGDIDDPSELVARGEVDGDTVHPVRFVSDGDEAWGTLEVSAPGSIDLAVAALIHGASADSFQDDAGALAISGSDSGELERIARVEDVLIRDAEGLGVSLQVYGAFTSDSHDLIIDGAGNEAYPYPVRIGTPAVGTLPSGNYTGNQVDEIQIDLLREINDDDSFPNLGVPYRIGSTLYVRGPDNGAEATLTIEAGVTVRFEEGGSLVLGDLPFKLGALSAAGTVAEPIVFTSAADVPASGDWHGLYFDGSGPTSNQLDHVVVEYAGGESSTASYGCGPGDNDASILITGWRPGAAFLQNSTVQHGGGEAGIVLGWSSDLDGPDFVSGNTFTDLPTCHVARWQNASLPYCPGNDDVDDCF